MRWVLGLHEYKTMFIEVPTAQSWNEKNDAYVKEIQNISQVYAKRRDDE